MSCDTGPFVQEKFALASISFVKFVNKRSTLGHILPCAIRKTHAQALVGPLPRFRLILELARGAEKSIRHPLGSACMPSHLRWYAPWHGMSCHETPYPNAVFVYIQPHGDQNRIFCLLFVSMPYEPIFQVVQDCRHFLFRQLPLYLTFYSCHKQRYHIVLVLLLY